MTHVGKSLKGRLGVATLIVTLIAPLGVSVNPAAAGRIRFASADPFCQALIATHPSAPTNNNPSVYHRFAKRYLSYYVKLQTEARDPNARSSLKMLVPILRVEARSANMKSLAGYVAASQVRWVREWLVFDKSVITCAAWAVNLI